VTAENKKKMFKWKPNWTDRETVILLKEYEKRKVILKSKFSSSITAGETLDLFMNRKTESKIKQLSA
jgi:hypothetical protein